MARDYVVRCEHGNIMTWISGEEDYRKHAAKEVAKLIRAGREVERVETAEIKRGGFGCEACRAAKRKAGS